jgi:lysophospholipid acyltransferase
MYVAYGKNDVDITAVLMMQVFLYVGFAYNYQDGLNEKNHSPRKIEKLPALKYFIGYVFFLPATLVGPVFEFKDYQNYLFRK